MPPSNNRNFSPSPAHRRHRLRPWLAALACSAAACGMPAAVAAVPSTSPAALAADGVFDKAPWWAAFHDATLNLLLAATPAASAGDRDLALQAQAGAVAEYIKARVYSVRLVTAQLLVRALEDQLALLRQGEGATDAGEEGAAALLMQQASERAVQFERLRGESLAALAALGKVGATGLEQRIAPALEQQQLPLPEFEWPRALPGIVLRQRSDVARAELALAQGGRGLGSGQLRLAKYLQALSAPIDDDQEGPRADDGETAAAALPAEEVLDRARRDIAGRLARVGAAVQAVEQQRANLDQLQQRYQSLRTGLASGDSAGVPALRALVHLMVEEDRMASASGSLALAWIALQAGIGGAGRATTSELLGATER
jgi:hypothetical protein